MKPRRTEKQKVLMGIILRAAGEGYYLTTKELHQRIPYNASYGAVRVSIRFLIEQEMLIRKPEGRVTLLIPTEKAFDWYRPRV